MTPTAYIIGNAKGYDLSLTTDPCVTKLGSREDYGGGWVWRTQEATQDYLDTHELGFRGKVYWLGATYRLGHGRQP